jgi:putative transposase
VLGLDVGDSEDGAFWTAFLRSLKARGLAGVQLVVSDAHTGLKAAISAVMAGACWQRSSVQTPGRRERPARHRHRRERTLAA